MATTPRPAHPQPVLDAGSLYLGDNGRCFCGAHAGHSAKYSGRDLSGQQVLRVTPAVVALSVAAYGAEATSLRCEAKGCTVLPPSAPARSTRTSRRGAR